MDDLALTVGVTLEWKTLLRDLDRLQQTAHPPSRDILASPDRRLAHPDRSIPRREDRPAAVRQADSANAGNSAAHARRKRPRPPEA